MASLQAVFASHEYAQSLQNQQKKKSSMDDKLGASFMRAAMQAMAEQFPPTPPPALPPVTRKLGALNVDFAETTIPSAYGNKITMKPSESESFAAILEITLKDGTQVNLPLSENVRINEHEDGSVSVYFANRGSTSTFMPNGTTRTHGDTKGQSGTAENDILINVLGFEVEGGTGDDTIFNLVSNAQIRAGAGNDSLIMAVAGNNAYINMGDGDDTITSDGDEKSAEQDFTNCIIDMGLGDDTLRANSLLNCVIKMGDGDDSLEATSLKDSTLDMGDGDNTLKLDNTYGSTITFGNGKNLYFIKEVGVGSSVYMGKSDKS